MSVSTSNDPVQTVIDILDNTVAGDYTEFGSKPTFIERQEETDQSTKGARSEAALYVYAPTDGEINQTDFGYETFDEIQRVTVDPWVTSSAADARALYRDLRDEIFVELANDNGATTNYQRIRPVTSVPLSHEFQTGATHFRYPLELRLRALRTTS